MVAIRGGVEAFLARDVDGGAIEPYTEVVVVAYEATIVGGQARPTDEALEVAAFAPGAIPWPGIGLDTTRWALRDWVLTRGIAPPDD